MAGHPYNQRDTTGGALKFPGRLVSWKKIIMVKTGKKQLLEQEEEINFNLKGFIFQCIIIK